jgi:hypothetical protein
MAEAALIIAILSLLIGGTSAAVQVITYVRDRPRLSVSLEWNMERGYAPEIAVDVRNHGRQPTTVMKCGLQVDSELDIEDMEGVHLFSGKQDLGMEEEPKVVMPGEVAQFRISLSAWPGVVVHADDPVRAFAVDSRDRTTWGPAAPISRDFLNHGWKPSGVPDSRLLEPSPTPRVASPVEPRWKIWKPRTLRKPTTAYLGD